VGDLPGQGVYVPIELLSTRQRLFLREVLHKRARC
jgi:hypothetical protein